MSQRQQSEERLPSDEQLQTLVWWAALICALALPTGYEYVGHILLNYRELNEQALAAMAQVFLRTGPLAIAVAFTTLCVMRDWFHRNGGWVIAGLFLGAWTLSSIGFGIAPAVPRYASSIADPRAKVVMWVLAGYWEGYGGWLFFASVTLGILLGVVSNTKMPARWRQLLDSRFSGSAS